MWIKLISVVKVIMVLISVCCSTAVVTITQIVETNILTLCLASWSQSAFFLSVCRSSRGSY